jgi:two-component system OmpR family response regulator
MPGMDGLDLCRQIRQRSQIPLIFVSSRDEELDRILGLEMGADDYVTKPFSPRELVARVKATLRRYDDVQTLLNGSAISLAGEPGLSHGPLFLDTKKHECRVHGQVVVLTVSEFSLLEALLAKPDQVLSRKQLVERAYGPAHYVSDRTVDSHVRRIRQKLKTGGFECIETVYGVGYRLTETI